MSTTIDNRVVKMTFDNAQFEKGIRNTMKTLDEFEQKLNFKGAATAFQEVEKASNKINLSGIGQETSKAEQNFSDLQAIATDSLSNIEKAASDVDMSSVSNEAIESSEGFNVFEEVAIGALRRVGEQITDFISNGIMSIPRALGGLANKAIWEPMSQGFEEYQTQIGSIQTIMANTDMDFDSDEDIKRVNDALDALNEYADQTIYNFTEMTRNIGTFTAAGLQLDESVRSIKGIANLAALSGASSTDASRAMYQLSQALASGTVTLQDWRSVESANMGGQIFQKSLARTAKNMSSVGLASQEAAEAGDAVLNQGMKIREALNQKDSDWGKWLTSDILSETLQLFTYDLRTMSDKEIEAARAHLEAIGYFGDAQDEVFLMAEKATRAATEVRTWKQLWETVGEAIGSGWSTTFRILVGDFKQATQLFTYLSNTINGVVDSISDSRNKLLMKFAKEGGRDLILGKITVDDQTGEQVVEIQGILQNLVDLATSILMPIADAFNHIFQINVSELVNAVSGVNEFIKSLILSEDAMKALYEIFSGIFAVVDIFLRAIGDCISVLFGLYQIISSVVTPVFDIFLTVLGSVGTILVLLHNYIIYIADAVKGFFGKLNDAFGDGGFVGYIKDIVGAFFSWADIPGKIRAVTEFIEILIEQLILFFDIPNHLEGFGGIFDGLSEMLSGFKQGFSDALNFIGDILGRVFPHIKEFFDVMTGDDRAAKESYVVNMIHSIGDAISKIANPVQNLIDALKNLFGRIGDFVINFQPFKDAVSIISSAKDTILDGLNSIFGGLFDFSSLSDSALGALPEKFSVFDIIGGLIQGFADIINNISIDGFLGILDNIKNTVSDTFSVVYDYIINFDPKRLFSDVQNGLNGIKRKASNLLPTLRQMCPPLDNLINALSDDNVSDKSPFIQFIVSVKNLIEPVVNGIRALATGFIDFGKKVYEGFAQSSAGAAIIEGLKTAIETASSFIGTSVGNIATAFANLKPEDVSNALTSLGDKFKSVFEGISKVLESVTKGFGDFIKDISNGNINLKDTLSDIIKWIENNVFPLKDRLAEFFSGVPTSAKDALANQEIPPLDFNMDVTTNLDKAPDIVSGIMGRLTKPFEDFSKTFTGIDLGSNIKTTFDNIVKTVKDNSGLVITILSGGLINSIRNFFKSLSGMVDSFSKVGKSLADLPNTLSKTITGFADAWNAWRKETPAEAMLKIAGALIILAAALWVIAQIPAADLERAGEALAKLAIGLVAIIGIFSLLNKLKVIDASNLKNVGEAAAGIAIGVLALAGAMWVLSNIKQEDIDRTIGTLYAILIGIGLLTAAIGLSGGGKSLLGTAVAVLILAFAMVKWIDTLKIWQAFDYNSVQEGLGHMIGFIAELGFALRLAGPNALKAAAGFVIMSVAMLIFIAELAVLAFLLQFATPELLMKVGTAMAMLAVFMLALGGAMRLAGPEAIKAGVGFTAASIGIIAIAGALALLTALTGDNPDGLGKSVLAILAIIAALAALDQWTDPKAMKEIAKALIIYGLGIVAIAGALALLTALSNIEMIVAATLAIGALIAEFAIISKKVKPQDLEDTAKAIIKFGLAVLIISIPLAILAQFPWEKIAVGALALGGLIGVFAIVAYKVNPDTMKEVAGALIKFGVSLVSMSISLMLLSLCPWEKIAVGALALVALIAALGVLTYNVIPEDLKKTSTALIIFGAALIVMSAALAILAQFEWERIAVGTIALIALIAALGILTHNVRPNDLQKTSTALVIFGAALIVMSVGLAILAQFDWDKLLIGVVAIGGLMLALGLLNHFVKPDDLIEVSAALVIFGAAVIVMSVGLAILAQFDWDKLLIGVVAIGGLILALGLLNHFAKPNDLIKVSAALVIFGAAIIVMSAGLAILAQFDWDKLLFGVLAIGGLILVLGILTALVKSVDLILVSVGLVAFGLAIVAMSFGLSLLAGLDVGALLASAAALAILIIAVGAIAAILAVVGPLSLLVLPLLALVFVAVGAAAWLIAQGMSAAVDAILRLAEAGPLLTSFATTIAQHLGDFAMAALAFVALGAGLAIVGIALIPLSIGLIAFGVAGVVAAVGIGAVTLALNAFLDFAARASEFTEAGGNITAGIGQGISGGLDGVMQAITGIGQGILQTILGFFGIHSPSDLMADEVGQFIPAGIAEGIDLNSDDMTSSLGDGLGGLLDMFSTWVQEEGLPKLQEFGEGLLDKLQNEIIPNLLDWVKTEGMSKLGEMGSDIVDGIVKGIEDMPHAISDAIVGLASGGLQGIKDFFGIASPSKVMRDEVGRWIPAGLAEGIGQYSKVAVDEGINMANEVSSGINDNISIVNPEMNFDYGTVTPVLDMSGVDSAIDAYNKQWSGIDFNAMNTNIQTIDANLDLTPMLQSTLDQTNQIGTLKDQNGELLNAIVGLRNEIAEYNDIMSKTALVMDTGALVGVLAPGMDSELGRRQSMARRGVI